MKILKTIVFIAASFIAVPLLIELFLRVFQAYEWIAKTVFSWQTNDATIFGLFATLGFTMLAILSVTNLLPDDSPTHQ